MLLFFFIITLAGPAIAEDDYGPTFEQSIAWRVGGSISIQRFHGDTDTGAIRSQQIRGQGDLHKTEDIKIANHIIYISERNDWSTAADAVRNLVVSSTIDLSHRPMSMPRDAVYTQGVYNFDVIHTYHPWVVAGDLEVLPYTDQIWAAEIVTYPGHSGSYHAEFTAAYGPGPYEKAAMLAGLDDVIHYDDDYMWWFDPSKESGIDSGDRYVGNYFEMDEYAYTSGGELRRYISISSPFSYALVEEELEVIGRAEIYDTFYLHNLERGRAGMKLAWYQMLF